MKTVSALISGADHQANLNGEKKPGVEHFVLSALNLEEGSARRVFERIGIDADQFRNAINEQYKTALSTVGIDHDNLDLSPEPIESETIFVSSRPSGEMLMKSLHALKKQDKDRPLFGAHVLAVVADTEHGVAIRAFRVLGVEPDQLATAVNEELNSP